MKKITKIWLFSAIALVLVAGITIGAVLISAQRVVYVPISERYLNKLEAKTETRREDIRNSPNMKIPKGGRKCCIFLRTAATITTVSPLQPLSRR